MKEAIYSEFAYDDAFRTMFVECDDLVLPLINEMFGENFDSSAKLIRRGNEHFIEKQGGVSDKRITDSFVEIAVNNLVRKYHVECESSAVDGTILVRLFEYDAQIALDDWEIRGQHMIVTFPHTGLLALRKSNKLSDMMKVEIRTPGGSCEYDVRVMKESDLSIDAIFEKRLYLLIPFYLFNLENELPVIDTDSGKIDELNDVYIDILERLDKEVEMERLSTLSRSVIISLTHRVAYKLSMKYENVQKKVGELMGGRVLDLDVIREYKRGRAEGEEIRKAQASQIEEQASQIKSQANEIEILKAENERLLAIVNNG